MTLIEAAKAAYAEKLCQPGPQQLYRESQFGGPPFCCAIGAAWWKLTGDKPDSFEMQGIQLSLFSNRSYNLDYMNGVVWGFDKDKVEDYEDCSDDFQSGYQDGLSLRREVYEVPI